MKIKTFQGGYDKNLSYLIYCEETKMAAVIDPAVASTPIFECIERLDLILTKILITHTHHDHYQYLLDYLFYQPNTQICCHNQSINLFSNYNVKGLSDNEVVSLGETLFIAIYTPGHYHDSICYWLKKDKILFTGDTMFVGRTGRTRSSTSNIKHLYHSVYSKIFSLPDDTIIFPGHHYGYTQSVSLKKNQSISDFFQCNSVNQFIEVMKKFERNKKK